MDWIFLLFLIEQVFNPQLSIEPFELDIIFQTIGKHHKHEERIDKKRDISVGFVDRVKYLHMLYCFTRTIFEDLFQSLWKGLSFIVFKLIDFEDDLFCNSHQVVEDRHSFWS